MSQRPCNKTSLIYYFLTLLGVILFFINYFGSQTPISLLITFFFLLLLPGFSLSRMLHINLESDLYGQFIVYLSTGLAFTLITCFIGIIFNITLVTLTWLYILLIIILFITSFILESIYIKKDDLIVNYKAILKLANIFYILAFIVALLFLVSLVKSGSSFKGGDVNYHLSLIRKVIGGDGLGILNLSYVKNKIDLVYGFPIWHVFMGILATITKTNMFAVWRDMTITLTVFSFVTWLWLCRKIFPTTIMSTMAFIIFMIFSFYWEGGYLFSTLPIPHTLSQIVLIPLLVAFSLEFIYQDREDKRPNYQILILLITLVLLFGAVHITSYFYYLFIIISLAVFELIFNSRVTDFWYRYKKVLLIIALSVVAIIPLALALEIKGRVISTFANSFKAEDYPTTLVYNSYVTYGPFLKYAFIGLPFVLFFIKKYKQLIYLPALFLLIPFVYTTQIGVPLIRTIGYVFVNRFIGTLDWSFLIWAFVLGFALIAIDRLFRRVRSRNLDGALSIAIILGVILAIYMQFKNNWALNLFNSIVADNTLSALDKWHMWVICGIIIIFLIGLLLSKKYPKKMQYFQFDDPKKPLPIFFLMMLIVFILISPDISIISNALRKNYFKYFTRPTLAFAQAKNTYYVDWAGGKEIINYINTEIPPKSVFDTNLAYFILPIVVDQHLPVYYSKADSEHLDLYSDDATIKKRLEILSKYQIDYVLVKKPKVGGPVFDTYPQYFIKLFESQHIIYKINKTQVINDYSNM